MTKVSAILLSGGVGTRLGALIPKQYLPLTDKPIVLHSFLRLAENTLIQEVIVVCNADYDILFQETKISKLLKFARPGLRRQDSLFNGAKKISSDTTHVLVHDAARPFISDEMINRVINEGFITGAATLAMPVKATIKETDEQHFVIKTLDRRRLFEIQTPQVLKCDLFWNGFQFAEQNGLTVTDDVYFAEILGHSVKLVPGSYSNIKITTSEDLEFARYFMSGKNRISMT